MRSYSQTVSNHYFPFLAATSRRDYHHQGSTMGILYDKDGFDVENRFSTSFSAPEKHRDYVDESGAVPGDTFDAKTGLAGQLQRIAGRFGVEQRGIERVPEDERTDKSVVKVGTMVCFFFTSRGLEI